MSVRVTNIQRMCFDDGPGIRTTVFMKGCSIHCPWCSNPENISFEKQMTSCGIEYGIDYEPQELIRILERDKGFWGCGGGITFSGGEVLMQAFQLEEVWKLLKKDGVHLAVETALFVPARAVEIAMRYIDFYYVDVKLLGRELCLSVLGGDLNSYYNNVEMLVSQEKDIHFRVPCSREYVMQKQYMEEMLKFFGKYKQCPIELFPLHDLGRKKYQSLGLRMREFEKVTEKDLEIFRTKLIQEGCNAEIINI